MLVLAEYLFAAATLLGIPLLLAAAYLGLLTVLSAPLKAPAPDRRQRFVVLVPAHNETGVIQRTVRNLLALDYPSALFRVQVIADNCTDDTADLARAAGAAVWQRSDTQLRGKGYALKFAYEKIITEGWADAVVVVDADTEASRNLLTAFAGHLQQGAAAVQAYYGVLNPMASWRTRLMTIALAIFHRLRGRARARLGVSNKLNGNGMCFTVATLKKVPHEAFSIAEDLEYGIALGRAGIRVRYADEAEVRGEMVSTAATAESQRQRWEGGRAQMRRLYGWPLLREALQQRSALLLDLAFDLLVPSLAGFALLSLVFALASADLLLLGAPVWVLLPAAAVLVILLLYVLRGVMLSGLGATGWFTLLFAPAYVLWRVLLRLKPSDGKTWIRTTREPGP